MMRQYVDLNVLANWVSMIRSETVGAILLPDDEQEGQFYERCAHRSARVVPATSMAVPLLQAVRDRGIRGVVAFVKGNTTSSVDMSVLRPEVGDVPSLLLCSSAYNSVMREICGQTWLTACEREKGDLRAFAVAVAARYHEKRRQAEASGEPPPSLTDELSSTNWECGVPGEVGRMSPSPTVELPELREALREYDGMMVLEIIAEAIRQCSPHGMSATRTVSAAELHSALRLAYPLEEMELDDLYWQVQQWQKRHQYRVLTVWRSLDPLGVVLDQRYWFGDLQRYYNRIGSDEALGVAKMDLDNFKNVNEALGHTGGDDAIKLYASEVLNTVGPMGDVYRRGGDEIIVIAPAVRPAPFFELCERIRANVESRFGLWCAERDLSPPVTASIGAVTLTATVHFDRITSELDDLQSEAKARGKNCVVSRMIE